MTNKTRKQRMERQIVELLRTGITKRQITLRLKVGKKRVNEVYKLALEHDYLNKDNPLPAFPEILFPERPDGRANRSSQVDVNLTNRKGWRKGWIEQKLLDDWTPITILEKLDVKISQAGFYRFLERHRLIESHTHKRVVPEIIHEPGECLQLDWGKLCDVWDADKGKKRALWAFVGVLGHSRYTMVRLVWTNSTGVTMEAIEHMLQELGGVPARITSDNPKCFAIKACKYEPILNPIFERFGAHYGITLECLPPRDPEKRP